MTEPPTPVAAPASATTANPTGGTAGRASEQMKELLRFVLVGGSAVTVDFGGYFLLVFAGVPTGPAKAASFFAGAVVAFIFNRSFTFRSTETASREQLLPFVLLYATSLGLNNVVNWMCLQHGAPKLLGWFVATAASTIWNFLGMKFLVFRKKPAR